MKNGDTTLQQVEKQQKDFKKELNKITSGNPKHKSNNQLNVIKNVKNFYNSRPEAIYKSKQNETKGKGLKILTPKQLLQRLAIVLAQVKAGNNSESLLNEIRQIVYSLYKPKQVTKKVYKSIIKSINI